MKDDFRSAWNCENSATYSPLLSKICVQNDVCAEFNTKTLFLHTSGGGGGFKTCIYKQDSVTSHVCKPIMVQCAICTRVMCKLQVTTTENGLLSEGGGVSCPEVKPLKWKISGVFQWGGKSRCWFENFQQGDFTFFLETLYETQKLLFTAECFNVLKNVWRGSLILIRQYLSIKSLLFSKNEMFYKQTNRLQRASPLPRLHSPRHGSLDTSEISWGSRSPEN